ncbi:MAG: MTH1187 family thiamine-binding protein [Candidatus Omnitrophica bacterium]|nr:MTH1187 family thiamine-binding protein [Candidatus Omnitrophota bacterium]
MIVEFSVLPIGKGVSISKQVAKAIDLVDQSGLPYKVTEMGTIVEGEWKEIFALIERCHRLLLRASARVVTTIKVDDPKGRKGILRRRIQKIETLLKRRVSS